MFLLQKIQALGTAVVVSLVLGFSTGYYTKYKFAQADIVAEVEEVRKEDGKAVEESQKTNVIITAKEEIINDRTARIQSEIKRYTASKTDVCSAQQSGTIDVSGHPTLRVSDALSMGEFSLLNAARKGTIDYSTLPSDEAGKAPSRVSRDAFIANDIAITGIYHGLATNHNALVDYVEKLQAEQRKRLGID